MIEYVDREGEVWPARPPPSERTTRATEGVAALFPAAARPLLQNPPTPLDRTAPE